MGAIDLSRFKVIYDEHVYKAVAITGMQFSEGEESLIKKPKIIEVMVINEDSHIILINDESWRFQFIPIVEKQ